MASVANKIPSKDELAQCIAQGHFKIEPTISKIFKIVGSKRRENSPDEPVKLLEVNKETFEAGIMPLYFGARPSSGIHYPSVIVVITPREFTQLKQSKLKLPRGWTIGPELKRKRGK